MIQGGLNTLIAAFPDLHNNKTSSITSEIFDGFLCLLEGALEGFVNANVFRLNEAKILMENLAQEKELTEMKENCELPQDIEKLENKIAAREENKEIVSFKISWECEPCEK